MKLSTAYKEKYKIKPSYLMDELSSDSKENVLKYLEKENENSKP